MDANKRLKLVDIGYEIKPTCSTCSHGRFENQHELFGTCKRHDYQHLKHSGGRRELSVFQGGSCNDHEFDATLDGILHGFREFIDDE